MNGLISKEANENYEVFYSPKFNRSAPYEVIGVECQLRFKVAEGITLSSNLLNAEEFAKSLGDQAIFFVLREAVKYISSKHPALQIYVSADQIDITDKEFPRYIRYICLQHGFPPENIVLDLSLGKNPIESIESAFKVKKFKEAGITVLFDPKVGPFDYIKSYILDQIKALILSVKSNFLRFFLLE